MLDSALSKTTINICTRSTNFSIMNSTLNINMVYCFDPGEYRLKYHLMSASDIGDLWDEIPLEHRNSRREFSTAGEVEGLVQFHLRNWLYTLFVANVRRLYTDTLKFCEVSSIRMSKLGLIDVIADDAVADWQGANYFKQFTKSPKSRMRKFARNGIRVDEYDHIVEVINALLVKSGYEQILEALSVLGKG
jgi:hypothetical protein